MIYCVIKYCILILIFYNILFNIIKLFKDSKILSVKWNLQIIINNKFQYFNYIFQFDNL